MKYFVEGQEVYFAQFLKDMGGSGVVYEDDIEKLLLKWESADWVYAYDYLGPIASEILIDAAETNKAIYQRIMRVVVESYLEMKRDLGLKPHLTRIK